MTHEEALEYTCKRPNQLGYNSALGVVFVYLCTMNVDFDIAAALGARLCVVPQLLWTDDYPLIESNLMAALILGDLKLLEF